ncbi:MAG: DUF4190 domain-containing protein [Nanoarchaeota archaeon]|nr:DUF4190 domain-containing protein [Nanoarchaeota archaeon]
MKGKQLIKKEVQQKVSKLAIASFVLGVTSLLIILLPLIAFLTRSMDWISEYSHIGSSDILLLLSFLMIVFGILLGLIAFILGIIVLIKIRKNASLKGKWINITGLIIGTTILVTFLLTILWLTDVIKPHHIKNGLCYSDFLENCEGKKVEVEGRIVEGSFCFGREPDIYILCDMNVLPCKPKYKEDILMSFGFGSRVSCDYVNFPKDNEEVNSPRFYDNCLALVQPCFGEDDNLKIKSEVERLLPNPAGKTVKIIGKIFVIRTEPFAKVNGVVGIVPESITVIENKN